jgi:hypothetical protein
VIFKIKFIANIHAQAFDIFSSQYKGIKKSILINEHVYFPAKRNNPRFANVKFDVINQSITKPT